MATDVSRLLSADNIQPLVKGRRFYRVFWQGVSPKAYPKDNSASPWRFSPFEITQHSGLIQGLYFADSAASAMRETLFRKGQTGVVPFSRVAQRYCVEVELKKELSIYLMTSELLQATLGFDPVQDDDYPVCLKLAQVLTAKFPQLQGIVFQGYQTDGHSLNLVTWSHTTSAADFKFKSTTRDHVLSPRYRTDLLAAASASGIELSSQVRDYCLGKLSISEG